jgi:hypothetical protein
MTMDRPAALRSLAVGDIFHAEGDNGASLICLITAITDTAIQARTVTSQLSLDFDRQTGIGGWGKGTCVVDSIAPLPTEIRDALLGLDRRYALGGDPKLLDAEKRTLVFVGSFYAANPI